MSAAPGRPKQARAAERSPQARDLATASGPIRAGGAGFGRGGNCAGLAYHARNAAPGCGDRAPPGRGRHPLPPAPGAR